MTTSAKSLDQKLERIASDSSRRDFILADAKDGDMGFGISAPGPKREPGPGESPFRTLAEYRQFMRDVTRQGLVDIMLMSASSCEVLAIDEGLFDDSPVTPAARMNDTTDIWLGHSGAYSRQPSLPFQTATIPHVRYGALTAAAQSDGSPPGANLGLYSVTLNNDAERDRASLDQYRRFRLDAEAVGFRHFLEVFAPNATGSYPPADVGQFVNDSIARMLGGVTRSARPVFLKIPYFGPAAMDALASYDPTLVVGILGGSSGTTFDAFQLLWEARKYGARAALFGRKINHAEDQLAFVQQLRHLADGEIEPAEAVRAYHGRLQEQAIAPHRDLAADLQATR